MAAPLPRVFEESAGGKAVPVPTAPGQNGNIGGDFRADELVRVSKDTVSAPTLVRTRNSQICQGLSPQDISCSAPQHLFATTGNVLLAEPCATCCSQKSWRQKCWRQWPGGRQRTRQCRQVSHALAQICTRMHDPALSHCTCHLRGTASVVPGLSFWLAMGCWTFQPPAFLHRRQLVSGCRA